MSNPLVSLGLSILSQLQHVERRVEDGDIVVLSFQFFPSCSQQHPNRFTQRRVQVFQFFPSCSQLH